MGAWLNNGCVSTQVRGNRELLVFLFNDFLLLVKSKSFFPTASEMEPFTTNYFTMYKEVREIV